MHSFKLIFMSWNINESELRRLDLNLLLVFSAVMQTGSAKAAADRLYMGPTAVSMALARLRQHVGTTLFLRSRSGLRPTRTAERLYSRLGPALAAIGDAITDRASFDPATAKETFRIGMTDDFEWWLLPAIQASIRNAAPKVTIINRIVDPRTAHHALDEGLTDVVLTAQPIARVANLSVQKLFTEDFVVLASANADLPERLTLDTYLGLSHALVSVAGNPWGIIDTELERLGHRRHVALSVQHFLTLPFLVAHGDLIATMPRYPAHLLADKFDLCLRELPFPSPTFEIGMTWHNRTEAYPASIWLRMQIMEALLALRAHPER